MWLFCLLIIMRTNKRTLVFPNLLVPLLCSRKNKKRHRLRAVYIFKRISIIMHLSFEYSSINMHFTIKCVLGVFRVNEWVTKIVHFLFFLELSLVNKTQSTQIRQLQIFYIKCTSNVIYIITT